MNRKMRIVLWVVIAVLIIAGFVWWQMWQLGRGLRTIHAENAQEVLFSAMSSQVLAPDVAGSGQQAGASLPLLDQDTNITHQRYLLVTTWLHASQIYKTTDWSAFDGKMLDSSTMADIPSEARVDGWRSPFCIWVGRKQVALMSSDGKGFPDCRALRQTAERAMASSHDARLTRVEGLLVTVQSRSGDATALAVQR